jgi:DNA-binding transcriptional LysR family regulator
LLELNELLQTFRSENVETQPLIRLAIAVPLVQFKLPYILKAFQIAHPGVVVQVYEYLFDEAVNALLAGRCDFALITCDDLPATLDREVLMQDETALVVSRTHPLGAVGGVELAQALAHPVLLPNERFPQLDPVYRTIEARGLKLRLAPEAEGVRHPLTLMIMAAAGLGVAILPKSFVPSQFSGAVTTVGLTDCVIPRQLGLAWVRGRRFSFTCHAFKDYVTEQASDFSG